MPSRLVCGWGSIPCVVAGSFNKRRVLRTIAWILGLLEVHVRVVVQVRVEVQSSSFVM